MKKILTLLVSVLCTLSVFGQSRMDYTRVNTVTQVGDTLVVKYQYFRGTKRKYKCRTYSFFHKIFI